MLSLEGKQLGNYDVIRRIRVGGMGAVYEGRQRTAFDRRVAIKVILGDFAQDRDMRRRFAREARTIARLHHPHILPLIEFGDADGVLYLVMPFIEGGTLTSYLRRHLPDLSEAASIYQQLLDAVEYAHDHGLIHRDIKSSNVLLEMRRSGPPHVYLADFGLVRIMRPGDAEQVGKPIPLEEVPGTPHYMAPEQTRGIITQLTDVYALGVLLYQLLTGSLPYNDPDEVRVIQMQMQAPIPSPCDRDASIPREVCDVVRIAMAKRPEDRYQSVAELRTAFQAALLGPEPGTEEDYDKTPQLRPRRTVPVARPTYPLPRPEPEPASLPTAAPEPLVFQRQPAPDPVPVALRDKGSERVQRLERVETPRSTDTVQSALQPRITEDVNHIPPFKRKRKGPPSALVALSLGVVLALTAFLVTHALGVNLLPAGLSSFGATASATVYIKPQINNQQDSYILSASTQIKELNVEGHEIPARSLESTAADNNTVATTGTRAIPGAPARGTLEFVNNSDNPVTVPTTQEFVSANGVHFRLAQNLDVPKKADGGKASATVFAITPGAGGNLAARIFNGPCCNNALTISNPAPFTGGSDNQQLRIVTQADLDGARDALKGKLEQQVTQQLQKALASDETLAGPPTFSYNVSSNQPVDMQADQVQVTLEVKGSAPAYKRSQAEQLATQLLRAKASRDLGSTYQLHDSITLNGTPTVTSVKNDTFNLSVSVHGTWIYTLGDTQTRQWRQAIKGATLAAAQAYLKSQPGVASVTIRPPSNSDHLPASIDDIRIELASGG